MQSTLSKPLPISVESLSSSIPGKMALTIAASLFVAACARASFPLPFTPVPLTLSNFAVILVGMLLGPVAGFFAMVMYLAEGAAGLPVFSPSGPGGIAQLIGPTAGFLFSYPLAAAIAGFIARSSAFDSQFLRGLAAGLVASLPVFVLGPGWLAHLGHLNSAATWHLAVEPFLFGEFVKVLAVAGIYSSLHRARRA